MAGRPPKPTALKILQGRPGHRALPKNEPVAPIGAKAPGHLSVSARALWNEWAPVFEAMGVLTVADTLAFGNWMTLQARIADGERGKTLPASGDVLRLAQSYAMQFGGTAAARAKITVAPKKAKDEFGELYG